MDKAKTIETTFAGVLKARGFRKRGRNWFRATSANEYQVVNLQKSSWGGGNFCVNLGWDPAVPVREFRAENQCAASLRAERTDAIPPIEWVGPDGLTTIELRGIILLDPEMNDRLPETSFIRQLTEVVVTPIADLMDRTPSVVDLVALLTAKPWFATLALRSELSRRGLELPSAW